MSKSKPDNNSIKALDDIQAAENQALAEKKTARRNAGKKTVKTAGLVFSTVMDGSIGAISIAGKIIATVLLIALLTSMIFASIFAVYVKTCLTPSFELTLEEQKLNESGTIWYQTAGGEWKELVKLSGKENRVWVNYESIPQYMEHALVAIEDKRFYEHKGVDWYRTSGAFVQMFLTMENSFGGSTVTQQLIKNITGKDDITVQRKLVEIFGAMELERKYDKKEIIEWYLNAVYFGEGCYGVQTAAQTYFGKDVSDLSLAECAAIVGITNKPTYYDPFYSVENNKERQETILREMYDQGYISYTEYRSAVDEELVFVRSVDEDYTQEIYSYYTEVVINDVIGDLSELKGINRESARKLLYNSGYQIYCCLDENVQSAIDAVYKDKSKLPQPYMKTTQQLQSAIVIMDPYDGRILGLSGGVGEKTANYILDRATVQKRPSGSSFKPVATYGPAMEYGLITPYTMVDDNPDIHLVGTNWYPKNSGNANYGVVTIQDALRWSLNTVSAQILDKLTPKVSYNFLKDKLGYTSLIEADCDYAPLALGQQTYGVTVREMTQAYTSFVNDGTMTYGRSYSLVTDSNGNVVIDNSPDQVKAFSANTAHCMTYMLERAVSNGSGSEAYLGSMPVAGKTGTTTDDQDRWFVGCTPYYVAAVWTGYDMPEVIYCYGNPAAQIWRKVMSTLHVGLEYKSFEYPYLAPNTKIFGDFEAIWEEEARKEAEARRREEEEFGYIDDDDTGDINSMYDGLF